MPRGALHAAAERGDLDTVRLELRRDAAQLEALTPGYNETPLHRAADNGHAEVVQELLGARADVNARRRGGYTALHLAHSPAVANLLLAAGINQNITCRKGKTAAEHCDTHIQEHIEAHVLRRAVLRMQNARLAAMFASWADHAQDHARLKMAGSKVVARMQHGTTASVFGRWVEFGQQQRGLRAVVARLAHGQALKMFRAWLGALDVWHAERGAAEHDAALAALQATLQVGAEAAVESKERALRGSHAAEFQAAERAKAAELAAASDASRQALEEMESRSQAAQEQAASERQELSTELAERSAALSALGASTRISAFQHLILGLFMRRLLRRRGACDGPCQPREIGAERRGWRVLMPKMTILSYIVMLLY